MAFGASARNPGLLTHVVTGQEASHSSSFLPAPLVPITEVSARSGDHAQQDKAGLEQQNRGDGTQRKKHGERRNLASPCLFDPNP